METITLTLNAKGRTRRVSRGSRHYLVVPVNMIVPGVLPGSHGPLFYPPEENVRSPHDWNGMPVVVYHPLVNGTPVSARTPEVWDSHEIGRVYNATASPADPVLRSEAWLDIEDANRVDPRVVLDIEAGRDIEVSTGLGLDEEPAEEGTVFNGVSYRATARNYRPDHLAILPDQKGACSLKDGCGIRLNQHCPVCDRQPMKEPPEIIDTDRDHDMNRNEMISYITTNCSCWNKPDDRKALETMGDDHLTRVHAMVKASKDKEKVINTPAPAPTPPIAVPVPAVPAPAPVVNNAPTTVALTPEMLTKLVTDITAGVIANVRNEGEKSSLVAALTAVAPEEHRTALAGTYATMTVEQLRPLAAALPPSHYPLPGTLPPLTANFGPAAGGVPTPITNVDPDQDLPEPDMTWMHQPRQRITGNRRNGEPVTAE